MTQARTRFRRMVLGLPHRAGDYAAVRAAADLAEALGIDLSAAYIEDETLLTLAQHEGVRELQMLGGAWHTLDPRQMMRDLERAAAAAERMFEEAVKTRRIEARFDFMRGAAADVFGSLAQAGDILAIVEPQSPAERITRPFVGLVEAALRTAAPVMLVPSRIARTRGPIVAVAHAPDDPSIETAMALAGLTHERVVLVNACGRPLARRAGFFDQGAADLPQPIAEEVAADAATLNEILARIPERLVVIARPTADAITLRRIPSLCGVPVLVTATDAPADAAEARGRRIGRKSER